MPPFAEHVLYSLQTFTQSTPLFDGSTVVPGTYKGHPADPGASGTHDPGCGDVLEEPGGMMIGVGVGVGVGGGAYAADHTRSLPSEHD